MKAAATATSNRLLPDKLRAGDEIRVLALSRSIGGLKQYPGISDADVDYARQALESLGLRVSFGQHVMENNGHLTTSVAARLADLYEALDDSKVKGILAVTGGIGAIQLLDTLDFSQVAAHPKILCGYSDITFLCNAIYARTGIVTYYGPHFSTFMMRKGCEYWRRSFQDCLFGAPPFEAVPSPEWSDDNWLKEQENRHYHPNDGWWGINEGESAGTVLGGAFIGLNLLQGSRFFPPLANSILFLECPSEGKSTLMNLDMAVRALTLQPGFGGARGVVIGRYARDSGIDRERMAAVIKNIPALVNLPVIANCDFGHTTPILTLPIGGHARLSVRAGAARIWIDTH
ncbi:MAG: S66 peptidase family protein [Verrucomicrobiota bacterium]|jgi:muramoyltetrapeptide carboxypeptidase LdcA involved in peptidoglycan recycling